MIKLKISMIILALIWILSLILMIISLTELFPNKILVEYRMLAGIGFIAITGFIRIIYRKFNNKMKEKILTTFPDKMADFVKKYEIMSGIEIL